MHFFDVPALISSYGQIGIFIIVFLESGIFFALPADSLLFTAGLLADSFGFNIVVLMINIFMATYFGALAGYHIGKHLEKLKRYKFWSKLFKQEYIDKTHEFFLHHGKYTLIISRFVPIVRTFAPIVAGVAKMDYRKFKDYSLIGAFIWSTSIPLAGYFLGKVFPEIQNYLTLTVLIIIFLSFLPLIIKYLNRKRF